MSKKKMTMSTNSAIKIFGKDSIIEQILEVQNEIIKRIEVLERSFDRLNKKNKSHIPGYTTHPGEILKDELCYLKMTQRELCNKIGYSQPQLNEVIRGKRKMTLKLAKLLQSAIKVDASYWMSAQLNYDLDSKINQ